MRKKLKICRGSSIAEMLVAVALLAILTAGGITAASAVMASFNRTRQAANADILASTVIEAFSNEVRLGRNITAPASATPSTELKLDSAFFGEGATIKGQDGHLVAIPKDPSGASAKELLSEDTYNGLKLTDPTFAKVEPTPAGTGSKTVYTIAFSVLDGSGDVLWTGSADAAPLQ